jgi:hypothetical protein
MCTYSSIFIYAYLFIYIYLQLYIGDSCIGKKVFQSLLNMNNDTYKNEYVCVLIHPYLNIHIYSYICVLIHVYLFTIIYR